MADVISKLVIRRLPKYLKVLEYFIKCDIERVSSKDIALKLGYTASQVRQDFNSFGGFGQHGYGYRVKELYEKIKEILGLNKSYRCIVIGAGNIGQAVVNYSKFRNIGIAIEAVFDVNPKIIGLSFRGIEVLDIEKLVGYIETNPIDVAILCIPESQVSYIYGILKNKVKGIWNFTTVDLVSSEQTYVENVDLNDGLFTLLYFIN